VLPELTVEGPTSTEKSPANYYPGRKPETPQEDWHRFVDSVKAGAKKDGPKGEQVDLTKATRAQKEEWQETGKVSPPKPEKMDSPGSEAKTEARDSKTVEDEGGDDEPRPDDRIWTQKLEGEDLQKHQGRLDGMAKRANGHIQTHPHRQHIMAGLNGLFAGRPAQHVDFEAALADVKNPGEVLAHIGLQKQDRDILLRSPNWQEMRKAVHQISKAIMPKPEPPRRPAPKTPHEVGGRGATIGDAGKQAARDGNFKAFDAAMRARYRP
jgi:hypothetical protein